MKKFDFPNFWYYHKGKLIAAVIGIFSIIAIYSINSGAAKPDFIIAYVTDGRTVSEDAQKKANDYFAEAIHDINNDSNKVLKFAPLESVRVDLEFASSEFKIVLLDGYTLKKYINSAVLKPLDESIDKYGLNLQKSPEVRAKAEGAENVHTYAIPVSNIPFLLEMGFPADNYYMAVRASSDENKLTAEEASMTDAIMDKIFSYKQQ